MINVLFNFPRARPDHRHHAGSRCCSNGLNFPSFVSDSSETKLGWNFVQRIHKKKETEFETIEFKGKEGKVAPLLCTQNMELSIIFLFDLFFLLECSALINVCPPRCRGQNWSVFIMGLSYLETLPSHPPWPGYSSQG